MNLVKNVKNKWTEQKFQRMKGDLIKAQQEILVVQDLLETSRPGGMPLDADKRLLNPAINNELEKTIIKKKGYDEGREFSCHIEPNDICEKSTKGRICNENKKLLKKNRLREGNEQKWLENIRELMEKQRNKSLEQQLTELMPLVRHHQDIKNAIKAKRIAARRKLNTESVDEFLNRLSELYKRGRNNMFSKKINKRIKCHKCKKRGHIRKNCNETKDKTVLRKRVAWTSSEVILAERKCPV